MLSYQFYLNNLEPKASSSLEPSFCYAYKAIYILQNSILIFPNNSKDLCPTLAKFEHLLKVSRMF